MGNGNGGYIDDLVTAYLDRDVGYALPDVAGKTSSEVFLGLDREQQIRYIGDFLGFFLLEYLPDDYFYVVLPNDCFRYKKNGRAVKYQSIPSSNGKAPTCLALDEIDKEMSASWEVSEIAALFYNQDAKNRYERGMGQRFSIMSLRYEELSVLGGKVLLYTCTVSKPVAQPSLH